MKNLFLMAGFLAVSVNVMAGDKGNGGDAVVCPDRVYMLDSHEVERKGNSVVSEASGLKAKVQEFIERIKEKDEKLASTIKARSDIFLADILAFQESRIQWQANTEFTSEVLVNVADEGSASVPAGCNIQQVIIQILKPILDQKKYKVQLDLWNKMTESEKAVAVIHEAIYNYLLEQDDLNPTNYAYVGNQYVRVVEPLNNSMFTRYFNGKIIHNGLKDISDKVYFELLKQLSFPQKEIIRYGVKFVSSDVLFDAEGSITTIQRGEFMTPVMKTYLKEGLGIKLGSIGGKKTWVKATAIDSEFVDAESQEILPLEFYYRRGASWPGAFANLITRASAQKYNVTDRNILLIGNRDLITKTEEGFELKNVQSCEFKLKPIAFAGEYTASGQYSYKCEANVNLRIDKNGYYTRI